MLGVAQNGLNLLVVVFGLTAPNVLTGAHLGSIAFQWPILGFLTLAMLIPMIPDAAMGANQHLSTTVWGLFLAAVMILRWGAVRWKERKRGRG